MVTTKTMNENIVTTKNNENNNTGTRKHEQANNITSTSTTPTSVRCHSKLLQRLFSSCIQEDATVPTTVGGIRQKIKLKHGVLENNHDNDNDDSLVDTDETSSSNSHGNSDKIPSLQQQQQQQQPKRLSPQEWLDAIERKRQGICLDDDNANDDHTNYNNDDIYHDKKNNNKKESLSSFCTSNTDGVIKNGVDEHEQCMHSVSTTTPSNDDDDDNNNKMVNNYCNNHNNSVVPITTTSTTNTWNDFTNHWDSTERKQPRTLTAADLIGYDKPSSVDDIEAIFASFLSEDEYETVYPRKNVVNNDIDHKTDDDNNYHDYHHCQQQPLGGGDGRVSDGRRQRPLQLVNVQFQRQPHYKESELDYVLSQMQLTRRGRSIGS